MAIDFYGIPNCDTVKKARTWLEARGTVYIFHDYKKEGADPAKLAAWVADQGRDVLLNTRGTTWKKLIAEDQALAGDDAGAVMLMTQHTSIIKRPVVEYPGGLLVGFKEAEWDSVLR